jgi:predicted transposase YdaD
VADRIHQIPSRERRRETLTWSRMLAGLRYDASLTYKSLKESDMLEESTVYQDIFHKGEGERKGLKQGAEQGTKVMTLRQLTVKVGRLPIKLGSGSNNSHPGRSRLCPWRCSASTPATT